MKYGMYIPTGRIMRVSKQAGFCVLAREPKSGYRRVRADLVKKVSEAVGVDAFKNGG